MATIKFKPVKKTGKTKIVVRLSNGTRNGIKQDFPKTLNLSMADGANWNEGKQRVKDTIKEIDRKLINDKLDELEKQLDSICNNLGDSKIITDQKWFNNVIDDFFNNRLNKKLHMVYLIPLLKKYVSDYINLESADVEYSAKTVENYGSTIIVFEKFEEYRQRLNKNKGQTALLEINNDWKIELKNFFKEAQYSPSSQETYLVHLKKILTSSVIEYEIDIKSHYLGFKILPEKEKVQSVYYSMDKLEELNNATNLNFYERRTRDWVLISSVTGLRSSDWNKLNMSKVSGIGTANCTISVITQKTGKEIEIPVHRYLLEVLARNNYQFPRVVKRDNFNLNVKKLIKKMGFDEEVIGAKSQKIYVEALGEKGNRKVTAEYPFYKLCQSHTGRRSFASNFYGILPDDVIIAICGWKDNAMFELYNKKERVYRIEAAFDVFNKDIIDNGSNEAINLHNRLISEPKLKAV